MLQLFVQLFARGRGFGLMGGGAILQPGGICRLCLGFGLGQVPGCVSKRSSAAEFLSAERNRPPDCVHVGAIGHGGQIFARGWHVGGVLP